MAHLFNVSQPFADVLKAFGIGDVVNQQDPHGSSVVRSCDCVKTLLSSRIPDETLFKMGKIKSLMITQLSIQFQMKIFSKSAKALNTNNVIIQDLLIHFQC